MSLKIFLILLASLFTFCVLFYASNAALLNASDEENHFSVAHKISLDPVNLNLPIAFRELVPHPLLQAYLIKVGFILFGKENILSGRFMFVILGTLGVLLVYFLVKKGVNAKVALLSIILLSVEKYYICHMRYAISESVCIFFAILAIYTFFKAIKENNKFLMILVGAIIGVGFYGKEHTLLLFPIFLIYLFWDKQYRVWLRRKEFYFAILICCSLAAPFIIYNLYNHFFSLRYITYAAKFGLSPLAATVLFGEPFSFLFDDSVIREVFDCEYPLMNWIVGVVVFCGVIYSAVRSRGNSLIKLLLVMFFFTFILFSIIAYKPDDEPNALCNGQNWASMLVVPGIIFAANMLFTLWNRYRLSRVFIFLFVMYLAYDMLRLVNLPESFYIPRKKVMLQQLYDLANYDLARGYYGYAKKRLERFVKWSKWSDEKDLKEAQLDLIYLSKIPNIKDFNDYYIPTKLILPDEIMRQADFLLNMGEIKRAIDKYYYVIQLIPFSASAVKAYNNLGLIYIKQGSWEQAKQHWDRALKIDPLNSEVKSNLDKYSKELQKYR